MSLSVNAHISHPSYSRAVVSQKPSASKTIKTDAKEDKCGRLVVQLAPERAMIRTPCALGSAFRNVSALYLLPTSSKVFVLQRLNARKTMISEESQYLALMKPLARKYPIPKHLLGTKRKLPKVVLF